MKSLTPKIGIMAIVVFLVVAAGVIFYKRDKNAFNNYPASDSNLSQNDSTLAASAENEGNIGDYYDGTRSANASSSASLKAKPADIKQYLYPSSTVKKSSSKKLELSSIDTPENITSWYKLKINELKFNAKAFSQTNTDGVIFNKFTAAKPGEKIEVTIKKDQTTSNTLITVDRS